MSREVTKKPNGVQLQEDIFDQYIDDTTGQSTPIFKLTWRNSNNVSVEVITYGAYITSIKVPDKNGINADIVMGFKDLKSYRSPKNQYIGATVGRVANRIGDARFTINGTTYTVSPNIKPNQLHGGYNGFDKKIWQHYIQGTKAILSYHSKDMEEGYPGDLITNITFELTDSNEFNVDFKSYTTKPTYVNLTNHSYFNLAGDAAGAQELYKHVFSINAANITETNKDSIPTGNLLPVGDTIFDLRIPKVLNNIIHKVPDLGGFDNNFCVNKGEYQGNTFISRVHHPPSGRMLEVYSNQPGVQFYTSNGLPEDNSLEGKSGFYFKHGAFCLETQNWPDAINHPGFPNAVLNPGETYNHTLMYKFSIE